MFVNIKLNFQQASVFAQKGGVGRKKCQSWLLMKLLLQNCDRKCKSIHTNIMYQLGQITVFPKHSQLLHPPKICKFIFRLQISIF